MALVELPVLFRRGSVRRSGVAETLWSAERNLPTHNMRRGTTSRSTGSKLPSGTRTVQVNTTQPGIQARLRHAVRGTDCGGLGPQRTKHGRQAAQWHPTCLGYPHHTEISSCQWHPRVGGNC